MRRAALDWEAAAGVNFFHAANYDDNCNASSPVVFRVQRVNAGGTFLAAAFFPSTPVASRVLQIDGSSYENIAPYTLVGVLRHELGHILGFRHEHTRPQGAGFCFEDNSWRSLTTYDSASVMHYPQCNGSNQGDLVLTARDKSGARALYPR